MLIVNADDWGRSVGETTAALGCYKAGRITSVSAMIFMDDSGRAAELALANGVDVGLHLNFTQKFTGKGYSKNIASCHHRIVTFLTRNKYSQLIYNPLLRSDFTCSFRAQVAEFERLYGRSPSHIDGLWSPIIPRGMKVRRNFSFWRGEKSPVNRAYRRFVDRSLSRRYRLTGYFFDLTQCIRENKLRRVETLAKSDTVELMTHPADATESKFLMSDEFAALLTRLDFSNGSITRSLALASANARLSEISSLTSDF
jgi:predicted glycoside hydrolase/deacetylase ChbG (UPF0249 family)